MNSDPAAPRTRKGPARIDLWLVAIVVLAAVGGALIVGKAKNWAVMPDELIYTELARSITHSVLPIPAFQDSYAAVYQVLFPTLLAPLLELVAMPTAYPWIAVLNACLLASTAIPAYLLTKYVTENRTLARWAALCCVITPWLIFATKVLPDALAYAATTWAIFAIARTASGLPRALKGDLLTLLAIVIAFLVRNQFLLLLGVWVGAVVLSQAAQTFSREGAQLLPRRLIALVATRPIPIFTFVAVFALLQLRPTWVLGFYTAVSTTGSGALPNEGIGQELINHASVFALGVAALPVILGLPWIVTALGRLREPRQFDSAVVFLLATCAMIYVGASFDMRFDPTDRVIERYIFYLAPVWFVAMAALFAHPPKNIAAFALPAMAGLGVAIATSPYGLDTALNKVSNAAFSPTQVTLIGWQKVADFLGTSIAGLLIVLALLICGFCWWCFNNGRQRLAQTACFAVLTAVLLTGTLTTVPDGVRAQNSAPVAVFGARDSAQKRWIEVATDQAHYAVAYSRNSIVKSAFGRQLSEQKVAWRDVAFWNRGLRAIYVPSRLPSMISTPLPGSSHSMLPNWQSGVLPRAANDDSSYLVMAEADPRFAPQTSVPPINRADFALYRTGPGLRRAAWAIKGLTWSGWVAPGGATMRIWAPRKATGRTKFVVRLGIGSTRAGRKLAGFQIAGAGNVVSSNSRNGRTFSWTTSVPSGGHIDFKLERGDDPARVELVRVSALRDSSGTSR